jgi:hypothetical protein
VFPARYGLNSYIVFRKRLVSKRLIVHTLFCQWLKLDFCYRKIDSWMEDGYLCRDSVIGWLQGVVDKVLRTVEWPPNMTVRINLSHQTNYSVV